jgi:hypothetical protein
MGVSSYLDLVPDINRPRISPSVAQEQPYLDMPGGIEGVVSADVRADSSTLYPTLADTPSTSEQPANFNSPSATDFLSWHTAWQIKYIESNGGASQAISLGSDASKITAFLGSGTQSKEVFVVQNLQKSDIGMMNLGTQERLSGLNDWSCSGGVAEKYGFSTGSGVASQRNALKATLQTNYLDVMTKPDGGVMTDADVKLFTRQIQNIMTRLDSSAVFNLTSIKQDADAILTRFQRASAFAIQTTLNDDGTPKEAIDYTAAEMLQVGTKSYYPDPSITPNTVSTDGNKFINKGYNKFITEEKRILQADNAKLKLGSLVTAQPQSVDLPRLIFFMQINDDLQKGRLSASNTEELKQQNRYVQDIGIFQRLVNKTIGMFGTGTDEKRQLSTGSGTIPSAYLSDNYFLGKLFTKEEMLAISIFEKNSTDLAYLAHPIEALRNLPKRPTLDLGVPTDSMSANTSKWAEKLTEYPRSTWDNYATMISDYLNNVNMASTMKQNENQNLDTEKNRHYDLANNCLSKMFDMLQSIARS